MSSDFTHNYIAVIANAEQYNSGGRCETVKIYLPTDKETVAAALKQIGLPYNAKQSDYIFDDFHLYNEKLHEIIKPTESLDELNYFSSLVLQMDDFQLARFEHILNKLSGNETLTDVINTANFVLETGENYCGDKTFIPPQYVVTADRYDTSELNTEQRFAVEIDRLFRTNDENYAKRFSRADYTQQVYVSGLQAGDRMLINDIAKQIHTLNLSNTPIFREFDKMYNVRYAFAYRLKKAFSNRENLDTVEKMRLERNYAKRGMYNLINGGELKGIHDFHDTVNLDRFTLEGKPPLVGDIIVVMENGRERAFFKEPDGFVEIPEFLGIEISVAIVSNYKGQDALIAKDGKVYLGAEENYLFHKFNPHLPFYDNFDNSLTFISDNREIFDFISGVNISSSQKQLIDEEFYTDADYKEFAELKDGILWKFEEKQELKFDGIPFSYPDYGQDRKPSIKKQLAESKGKAADVPATPAKNKNNDLEV